MRMKIAGNIINRDGLNAAAMVFLYFFCVVFFFSTHFFERVRSKDMVLDTDMRHRIDYS